MPLKEGIEVYGAPLEGLLSGEILNVLILHAKMSAERQWTDNIMETWSARCAGSRMDTRMLWSAPALRDHLCTAHAGADPITLPHALPELVSRRWSSAIDEIPRITPPVRLTTEKNRKQARGRLQCYRVIADYRSRRAPVRSKRPYSISENYK